MAIDESNYEPALFPATPEEVALEALRKQIKEIEAEKARDHRRRMLQEEAESIRKQLRSWGITPAA